MTDLAESECRAFELVFPSVPIQYCWFHLKQAWSRWLTHNTGLSKVEQDHALNKCEALMRAESEEELNTLWEEVKLDEVFRKEIVRATKAQKRTSLLFYMEQYYMNKKERWVMYFRRHLPCFLKTMHTNNHTES